jgi:hypothetical protein
MQIIPRQQVKPLLDGLKNGTIYSVTFTKKDGSVRLMNSIKGTKRGVKGVGLAFNPDAKGLIPVYDIQLARTNKENPDKCWRMINVGTISKIVVANEVYNVVD